MSQVRKAVIPMAGKGTRFRPITHVVPKEFLPIVDRPVFHYILDEVRDAGCKELICVVARGRDLASEYIAQLNVDIQLTIVYQEEACGLGHAIGCAADAIGDNHFFVLLPDVIIDAPIPVCAQMQQAYDNFNGGGVIAIRREPRDKLSHYGIVKPGQTQGNVIEVADLVEKPKVEEAPSDMAIVGRYLLPPSTFEYLRDTKPGAKGEIQLTDALRQIAHNEGLHALLYDETAMFDTGQPPGWLAANQYFGKRAGLI